MPWIKTELEMEIHIDRTDCRKCEDGNKIYTNLNIKNSFNWPFKPKMPDIPDNSSVSWHSRQSGDPCCKHVLVLFWKYPLEIES